MKLIIGLPVLALCVACKPDMHREQRLDGQIAAAQKQIIEAAEREILLSNQLSAAQAEVAAQGAQIVLLSNALPRWFFDEIGKVPEQKPAAPSAQDATPISLPIRSSDIALQAPVISKASTGKIEAFFPEICNRDGGKRATNATFLVRVGSKLYFKLTDSVSTAYDAWDVHPDILKALGVDLAQATDEESRIRQRKADYWRRYNEEGAAEMEGRREAAMQAAAWQAEQAHLQALRARQAWEDSIRQQQADAASLAARAAAVRAAAAVIQAQQPPIQQVNVQQISR